MEGCWLARSLEIRVDRTGLLGGIRQQKGLQGNLCCRPNDDLPDLVVVLAPLQIGDEPSQDNVHKLLPLASDCQGAVQPAPQQRRIRDAGVTSTRADRPESICIPSCLPASLDIQEKYL